MANTLVNLAEAMAHLRRVSPSSDEGDILLKAQQASDIVVNYLKARQSDVSSITSVGGVATVTTPSAHGLSTGATVTVRVSDQPEYSGDVVITVTGTTTFTYPITGTPEATATGSIGLRVTPTWTDVTVPPRVKSAVLLVLTHLYDHRGEDMSADENLWSAIRRLLERDRDPAMA